MTSTITDRLNGVATSVANKVPAHVATTENINLYELQDIDGITVKLGDRVLVKDQTDQRENGIYKALPGDWMRAPDFDGSFDAVGGTLVYVDAGTAQIGNFYRVDGDGPIKIGTDNITWTVAASLNGQPGPASSTYTSLALLKAAPASNLVYSLVEGGSRKDYSYQTAGAPYIADDENVVKLDDVALSVGALVKNPGGGLTDLQDGSAPGVMALGQSQDPLMDNTNNQIRFLDAICNFDHDGSTSGTAQNWYLQLTGHGAIGWDSVDLGHNTSNFRLNWLTSNPGFGAKTGFGISVDQTFHRRPMTAGASVTTYAAILLSMGFQASAKIFFDSAQNVGTKSGWIVEQSTAVSQKNTVPILHDMEDSSWGDVDDRAAYIAAEAAAVPPRTFVTGGTTPTRWLGNTLYVYWPYAPQARPKVFPALRGDNGETKYYPKLISWTATAATIRFYYIDETTGDEVRYTPGAATDDLALWFFLDGFGNVRVDHGFGSDMVCNLDSGEVFFDMRVKKNG